MDTRPLLLFFHHFMCSVYQRCSRYVYGFRQAFYPGPWITSSVCLKGIQGRASDISRKKKQNFAGFSGANSRKNRPISREKSQNSRNNRTISGNFRGRKVKIRRKIGPFRGILAEKSQISKDFLGQILRKIGRFHGKFRGGTSPRNNQ